MHAECTHIQKSTVFFEMAEKKQLPDSAFWGGAELTSGGAKRRGFAEKVPKLSTLEDQQLATCDKPRKPEAKMEIRDMMTSLQPAG